MSVDIEFDMTCPFYAKTNLVNEISRYVKHFNGRIDYVERGLLTKHLHFFIKVAEKYRKDIEYMYEQLQEYAKNF